MKYLLVAGMILLMISACHPAKKEIKNYYANNGRALVQEQDAGGVAVKATYLPVQWERILGRKNPDAEGEITFKLNVALPASARNDKTVMPAVSVDTLFWLVAGSDTLAAQFTQRIPNGSTSSAEYLTTFKRAVPSGTEVLYFVMNDWIYTHHKLVFPFQVAHINSIDSLSSRL
ncbi:hypothetical protein [Chitinophaga arvensicola]|uniref:Lipoprotein n=1 Tax=Chitinophaga arvensicola TaxID=29529 RepID=A0A1I0S9B8_9BACT|nr:hypothetical protein [Chitinophaga arvensicola]SEW52803.1 hypothetical protein SAMN04488122_5129 [Chitinophaga arvensicola]